MTVLRISRVFKRDSTRLSFPFNISWLKFSLKRGCKFDDMLDIYPGVEIQQVLRLRRYRDQNMQLRNKLLEIFNIVKTFHERPFLSITINLSDR